MELAREALFLFFKNLFILDAVGAEINLKGAGRICKVTEALSGLFKPRLYTSI